MAEMAAHAITTLQVNRRGTKLKDEVVGKSLLVTDLIGNRLTSQRSSNLARSLRAAGQKRDKRNVQI